MNYAESVVLGFWIGDGNWRQEGAPELSVTESNAEGLLFWVDQVQPNRSIYVDGRPFRSEPLWRINLKLSYGRRMWQLGFVRESGSARKFIPEKVLEQADLLGLLTGLWMSDGTLGGKQHPQYYTVSQNLAEQVAGLLRRVGQEVRVYQYQPKPQSRAKQKEYIVYLAGKRWSELLPKLQLWGKKELK